MNVNKQICNLYIYHIVVAAYIYSSTCGGFFYEISAVFLYPLSTHLYLERRVYVPSVTIASHMLETPPVFPKVFTITYIIAQTWVFKRNSTLISAALRLLHLPIFVAHYNCFILYLYWLWACLFFYMLKTRIWTRTWFSVGWEI